MKPIKQQVNQKKKKQEKRKNTKKRLILLKRNWYRKLFLINKFSKQKRKRPNLKYSQIQEAISESVVFLKNTNLFYINPNLIIQNLRNFIKLVLSMKKSADYLELNLDIAYNNKKYKNREDFPKFILLFTSNVHVQRLLRLAIQKMTSLSTKRENILNFVEVGGINELTNSSVLKQKKTLVVFLEQPRKGTINYCTWNQFYILSIFFTHFAENLRSYGANVCTITYTRAFWILNLIRII